MDNFFLTRTPKRHPKQPDSRGCELGSTMHGSDTNLSPAGATPSQPRVKPWVTRPDRTQSPERATYRWWHDRSPFQGSRFSWFPLPRVSPWAVMASPLRGLDSCHLSPLISPKTVIVPQERRSSRTLRTTQSKDPRCRARCKCLWRALRQKDPDASDGADTLRTFSTTNFRTTASSGGTVQTLWARQLLRGPSTPCLAKYARHSAQDDDFRVV